MFALVNLPEVVKGALFARYSRTQKSLRRLFLDEFAEDVGGGRCDERRRDRARRDASTTTCSSSTATTRWRSSAACTSRASRHRSSSRRRSSGGGSPRTSSSPRGTCATTTVRAAAGASPSRPRLEGTPARGGVPGVRRPHVRGVRPDVPAAVRPLRRAVPEGPDRLRLPLPLDDHREDLRHAPRPAAGGHALEPRRVRHGPVVRADAAADAGASARRGARLRRPDARRAPQGDPRVPQARRPRGPRRRVDHVPPRDARGHAGHRGEVHRRRRCPGPASS